MLRSSLGVFVMLGDGPVGSINVDTYRRRLSWLGKRALTDENFMEELVYAGLYSPEQARNGIKLMNQKGNELNELWEIIGETSGRSDKVLLIVLDPMGRDLI